VVGVPFVLEGEAHDVLANNGLVDLAIQELQVRTTPRQIPDSIVIDVTDFTLDTVIRIEDLTLPSGVEAIGEPDTPVVTVLIMRGVEEEEAEAAEGEAAEGDEAAAEGDAEGGEAASGDASSDD